MNKFIFILFLSFSFSSCINDTRNCAIDSFDREKMLTNWADNIIIPSYDLYVSQLADVENASEAFIENPNTTHLETLRAAWLTAYNTWQNVSIYEIGQAEILRLRDYTNSVSLN